MKSNLAKCWITVGIASLITAFFEEIIERRALKHSNENWDKAIKDELPNGTGPGD
jgi:hypothetical protein